MKTPPIEPQIPFVHQYMTRSPTTIAATEKLSEAERIMKKFAIHHLPVMSGERLVGMLSIRDIQVVAGLTDARLDQISVDEAMSEKPYAVPQNETIDKVAAHMAAERLGSAIVLDDIENVVGVFTTHDALTALFHVWKH